MLKATIYWVSRLPGMPLRTRECLGMPRVSVSSVEPAVYQGLSKSAEQFRLFRLTCRSGCGFRGPALLLAKQLGLATRSCRVPRLLMPRATLDPIQLKISSCGVRLRYDRRYFGLGQPLASKPISNQ